MLSRRVIGDADVMHVYTHVSAARRRRVVQLLDAPGDIRSPAVYPRERSNKRRNLRKRAREGL
jgi:hypothetical protein